MSLEVKYVPKDCEGENPKFKGHVILVRTKLQERYEFRNLMQFKVDGEGSATIAKESYSDLFSKGIQWALKFIKEVHIENSEGYKYKDLEDLCLDPETEPMVLEIVLALGKGFSPSKN